MYQDIDNGIYVLLFRILRNSRTLYVIFVIYITLLELVNKPGR
jgi:hypothetical protein